MNLINTITIHTCCFFNVLKYIFYLIKIEHTVSYIQITWQIYRFLNTVIHGLLVIKGMFGYYMCNKYVYKYLLLKKSKIMNISFFHLFSLKSPL